MVGSTDWFFDDDGEDNKDADPRQFSHEIIPIQSCLADAVKDRSGTLIDRGPSTGWTSLDEYYRPARSLFSVIYGTPSHGKSTFIECMMMHLIQGDSRWKFCVYSSENQPVGRYARLLAEKYVEESHSSITVAQVTEALEDLSDKIFILNPAEQNNTIDDVLAMARLVHKQHDIQALIIDPWGELDHSSRPKNISETEYIGMKLNSIRRFARETNTHVFLVAHPTKLYRDPRTGRLPVPSAYDISGSASFRNKGDFCLGIWRENLEDGTPTLVQISKVRFREHGKPGDIKLRYNWRTSSYEEIPEYDDS